MTSILEKGGGTFAGIKILLCENPLPPLDEAITAAQEELACSSYYTEAYSPPASPAAERTAGCSGATHSHQCRV